MELLAIAAGSTLRPLAGAAATGVPPSRWFLAVCILGSLTVAFGKRCAELRKLGAHATRSRPVLAHYTISGLVIGRQLASFGAILAYHGWAVTRRPARNCGVLSDRLRSSAPPYSVTEPAQKAGTARHQKSSC